MGQAKRRKLAIEAGTASPEDLLRGSLLLGKDGMLTAGEPDEAPVKAILLVAMLKDPRVAGMPVSGLVPHLATAMRLTAREHLADETLKMQDGERTHTQNVAEALERFPLPPKAEGDEGVRMHLDDFAEFSQMHLMWLKDVSPAGATVADGAPAFAALLGELDRLAALPPSVTVLHLAKVIARKFGLDFESASQDTYDSAWAELEFAAGELDDEDDDERVSYLDTFPPDAGFVAIGVEVVRRKVAAIVAEMEKEPGSRDLELIAEAKEMVSDAAEQLAGWAGLYDARHPDPDYPFESDDPGRAALLERAPVLEEAARRMIAHWDGANVQDVAEMLELIQEIRGLVGDDLDTTFPFQGIEEEMVLGREAVIPYVLDDGPELMFQDVDGDIALYIDCAVTVLPFGDEAVFRVMEFSQMEACRKGRWNALLAPALPALVAQVKADGGMDAWTGREDDLFVAAAPALALLVSGSLDFRDYAIATVRAGASIPPSPPSRNGLPGGPPRRVQSGRPYSRTIGCR